MRVVKACFCFLLGVVSKVFLADAPANTTLLMGVGCCVSCILCCKFVIAALVTGYSFRDVLAKQTNKQTNKHITVFIFYKVPN